jgi:hypothetical protein
MGRSIGRMVARWSEGRQRIYGYMCAPMDTYIENRIFGIALIERCLGQKILGKIFLGKAYKDIKGLQSVEVGREGRRVLRRV